MICKSLLAITLALSISVSSTKAADDPYAAMQNFTKLTSKTINSAGCLVMGSADFDTSKQYLPIFREEWLNRDYSLDFYVQRGKQVFLYMIVKRFAELITEGLYSHGGPPQCSFAISISYIDKLGQPKVLEAVTWQFTQKRASEVNWEKIDPRNFNEIALDYKFGPQVSEWTAGEPSFGPPSTPSASCRYAVPASQFNFHSCDDLLCEGLHGQPSGLLCVGHEPPMRAGHDRRKNQDSFHVCSKRDRRCCKERR